MLLVTRDDTTILLNPSVCHICEQSPQPGTVLVDTLRNYDTGINGSGRKYVCESCVGELAGTLGLSSGVGERLAKAENAAYARSFETLRYRLREQAEELVKLVNEPLTNLDPLKDVKVFESGFATSGIPLDVEEIKAEAKKPARKRKEPIGVVESNIGTGQDSFQVEGVVHQSRSAGM